MGLSGCLLSTLESFFLLGKGILTEELSFLIFFENFFLNKYFHFAIFYSQ